MHDVAKVRATQTGRAGGVREMLAACLPLCRTGAVEYQPQGSGVDADKMDLE